MLDNDAHMGNIMSLDDNWFTEICNASGSAYSLKVIRELHAEQSEYQHIAVYETEKFGNLMVIDGFIMLSSRDNFLYHEMMTHPVLFSHAAPKRVVIIGGGDCGTLQQVLRHPVVEQAWQIEIDERVTRLAEQFFPELCADNHDSRAQLLFEDGIKWMREREDNSVDVIIVDSTDPIGPAEGLFGESFYQQCQRVLAPGGYLAQQSESPLIHDKLLQEMHHYMRKAGMQDVQIVAFPQPVYPSGWWTATIARVDGKVSFAREAEAKQLAFKTRYYNAELHKAAFVQAQFVKELLAEK